MRQTQDGFQHPHQRATGAALFRFTVFVTVEHRLGQLQIPVAVLVPDELVGGVGSDVETELVERLGDFGFGALQRADDPAIRQGQGHFAAVRVQAAVLVLGVHQYVARGVPDLVAEVTVAFDAAHVPLDVAAGGGQRQEGEAQRVGAVGVDAVRKFLTRALADLLFFLRLHQPAGALVHQGVQVDAVDQIERVQHIALGLGHLLAFRVAHQAVHVHLLEGHLAGELQRHHDHPRDPEENDVETGYQHIGGVEGFQLFGLFRPAQGGEGPQRGAEPGIQYVLVLAQGAVAQVVLAAHLVLVAAHIDVAVLVVPGGNPVAPPQLP